MSAMAASVKSASSSESVSTFSAADTKYLMEWLGKIPFTRPTTKNIFRDFSDGVLMAELIAHFFPKMIQLHNYVAANGPTLKKHNWELLNTKIFPKLGIKLTDKTIDAICHSKAGYIEPVICQVRRLIDKKTEQDEASKAQKLINGGSGDGPKAPELKEVMCQVHLMPSDRPEYLILKGIKFVPEELLNEVTEKNAQLKGTVKEMSLKVQRLETMVTLKETHLDDLTKQIHDYKMKLDEVKHGSICRWDENECPSDSNHF